MPRVFVHIVKKRRTSHVEDMPFAKMMTALQTILFNKQLCMRPIYFFLFEKCNTIFLNCAILFSKNIQHFYLKARQFSDIILAKGV
ncbi:hypothetical protein BD560DRAFT_380019 [Blakeslea trispora]|nr:hypothetical protein BD560DRAFT_380019 [Blakeslea trispora]